MHNIFTQKEYFALLGLTDPCIHDRILGMKLSRQLETIEKEAILANAHKKGSIEQLKMEAEEFFEHHGNAYFRYEDYSMSEVNFFD
jgi:hypothetical protein